MCEHTFWFIGINYQNAARRMPVFKRLSIKSLGDFYFDNCPVLLQYVSVYEDQPYKRPIPISHTPQASSSNPQAY